MCFAMIPVKSIRVLKQLWPKYKRSSFGCAGQLADLVEVWVAKGPRDHKLGRYGLVENWLRMMVISTWLRHTSGTTWAVAFKLNVAQGFIVLSLHP